MLPRTNQSQILPFFLFSFLSHFSSFPLTCFIQCRSSIWAICWHRLAAVWQESNRWHTTLHLLLLLQKDLEEGREGGMWGRRVGASTVGKLAQGQKLEPENQVSKTKWWCVFSTQLFFSFSPLLLLYLKSLALVD